MDNGLRFVSNFRYNVKKEISANPLAAKTSLFAQLDTSSEDAFDSSCSQTMVGVVQRKNNGDSLQNFKAECFVGR